MPRALLKSINEEAEAEGRSRSNWIVWHLSQVLASKKQERNFSEVGEFSGVDAGDPSSGSTRVSPAPFSPPEITGLNEDPPPLPKRVALPHPKSTKPGVRKTVEGT